MYEARRATISTRLFWHGTVVFGTARFLFLAGHGSFRNGCDVWDSMARFFLARFFFWHGTARNGCPSFSWHKAVW